MHFPKVLVSPHRLSRWQPCCFGACCPRLSRKSTPAWPSTCRRPSRQSCSLESSPKAPPTSARRSAISPQSSPAISSVSWLVPRFSHTKWRRRELTLCFYLKMMMATTSGQRSSSSCSIRSTLRTSASGKQRCTFSGMWCLCYYIFRYFLKTGSGLV